MKIGYYVQGSMDEAFVHGLAKRWCPDAELAPGEFRGNSGQSFRRELPKALRALRDAHKCDVLIALTDSDVNDWREVKRRESARIPADCEHLTVFGVAERNIECWMALDSTALAKEIACDESALRADDPSGVVKRGFGASGRDITLETKTRVRDYVAAGRLYVWLRAVGRGESFADFYDAIRSLATRTGCSVPNERNSP